MNVLTFTYTKADGSVSKRVFYPLITPNKMYEGIDIGVLEPVDQVQFIDLMEGAKENYLATITQLRAEFDLNQDYRRFDPKKMTDIVEEHV